MVRKKTRPVLAIAAFFVSFVVVVCDFDFNIAAAQMSGRNGQAGEWDMWDPPWMQRQMWGPGSMNSGMRQRVARHWTFMHQGLPPAYHVAINPLSPDEKTLTEGRVLYRQNCASCHGKTGMGEGENAKSLSPSPALLAYMIQMPMSVDGYMLWTISEGGAAFGTAMPAFKGVLSTEQIWKIVTYMRSGFPEAKPRTQNLRK